MLVTRDVTIIKARVGLLELVVTFSVPFYQDCHENSLSEGCASREVGADSKYTHTPGKL
jgi:hypothetical protein